jgi:chromosomal replication initiator protein
MAADMPDSGSQAQALWDSAYALMTRNPKLSNRDRSIIKDISPSMVFDSMIVLVASNDFTRVAIENQFDEQVQSALSQAAGRAMSFVIKIDSNKDANKTAPAVPSETVGATSPAPTAHTSLPASAVQATPATPNGATRVPAEQITTEQIPEIHRNEAIPRAGGPTVAAPTVNEAASATSATVPVRPAAPAASVPSSTMPPSTVPTAAPQHATQDVLQGFGSIGDDDLLAHTDLKNGRQSAGIPTQNNTPGGTLPAAPQQAEIPFHRDEKSRLNKDATFENFVPGESNRFARAAAFAVSEAPGNSYNPLFIYGGSGLGKTHLLNAIGNYALNLYPDLTVRYVNSEEFTNEFIEAVKEGAGNDGEVAEFNRRYREVDLLLIDDIQFLGGKTGTMETFFHTFNALYNANKQIVVASDVAPKLLQGFEQRLISRFEMGLTVDVQPPNQETRIAILRMKASTSKLKLEVPMEVLDLIAQQVTDNIRELEGALTRVVAMASLNKQPVTTALAEQTLQDYFVSDVQVTPTDIISQTAGYFQLTFDDLVSSRRSKNIALARQVAMYICREMTGLSLTAIGEIFGGRDHTTVIHAYQKISSEMSEKREVYNYVNELTSKLKQHME